MTANTKTTTFKKPSTTGMVILGILAVLALLGLVTGVYRLVKGLGATTDLSDQYAWGLWLGFDFGLIAFGGAAFTLAAVVHVLNLKKYEVVLRPALLTGFLGYVSVLVILLLDLGRPDRFWGFIVYPNIHSPLFEISWCILLYTVVLTLEIAPLILEKMNRHALAHTLHKAVIPVTIAGVTLSTLHQSTLGTMYLALPGRTHALWWSWLLPLLYYLSAIGMGLSATILVMIVGSKAVGREVETDVLAGLGKGSVWIWIVYLIFRFGDLLFTGDMAQVFAFDSKSILFWIEILMMAVAPIVLYSMEGVRKSKSGLFWTALITTVGLFFNRFDAMFSGSPVPVGASHAEFSYFPSWIEFAVQFGVLAAAALVWYLAARFLPVFSETIEEAH